MDAIKTLPATGGNFAFEFPATDVAIEYKRPDGALDKGHVNVISIVPYLVMKTMAMGRGKAKDAYDIYCTINNFQGGVRALANEFVPYIDKELVQKMCQKLDEEERARIQQDAYQKVHYLVQKISSEKQ